MKSSLMFFCMSYVVFCYSLEASHALMSAIENGTMKQLQSVLAEKGGVSDKVGSNGLTPFLFAVTKGDKNVVELLLEHKANPMDCTNNGFTALDLAIWHQVPFPLVTLLRDLGVKEHVRRRSLANDVFLVKLD